MLSFWETVLAAGLGVLLCWGLAVLAASLYEGAAFLRRQRRRRRAVRSLHDWYAEEGDCSRN